MKSILKQSRWSPYGVGIGIGMLSWVTFAFMGKALGASTTLVRAVAAIEGTIAPSHVYANIKAAGIEHLPQNLEAPTNYLIVLVKLFVTQLFQISYVPVRSYHQVPRVIGIAVHNDEVFVSPIQDVVQNIIAFFRLVT